MWVELGGWLMSFHVLMTTRAAMAGLRSLGSKQLPQLCRAFLCSFLDLICLVEGTCEILNCPLGT